MDKTFPAKDVEARLLEQWEADRTFWPGTAPQKPKAFLIPPPNITGPLHMGHGLNVTLADIFARFTRQGGDHVLLKTGFDHAGQTLERVMKKNLEESGISLHDLDRDELIDEVWKWKAKCEPRVNEQLRRLGVSTAYSGQPFTLDASFSASVYQGFLALYQKGYISCDEKLVDWCPRCSDSVADPDQVDVEGSLWQITFEIRGEEEEGDEAKYLAVTTTAPEALCCTTAVAVHPEDERYVDLQGRTVRVPLLEGEVPVVAHESVDPKFGSGAVPLAPGFSQDDYKTSRDCGVAARPLVTPDGKLVEGAGRYGGLDIHDARTRIVHDLEGEGRVQTIKSHPRHVAHCPRCQTAVVPLVSERWFMDLGAESARVAAAVREGELTVTPSRWREVILHELDNPRPWNISRLGWWGMPVPAFYCNACSHPVASSEAPPTCPRCKCPDLRRETGVLDTWFTVSFWPLAVFRWPEGGDALAMYYPSETLATGGGVVRSWIAKMLVVCSSLTGRLPFRKLLVHGTVVDDGGRKMSKSLENGIDPLDLIDMYSADAVRFALALMASEVGDVSLSKGKLGLAHNFVGKVWNVARFVLLNRGRFAFQDLTTATLAVEDAWILRKLTRLADVWTRGLEELRAADVAHALYEFVWHDLCDWYVEAARSRFSVGGESAGVCYTVFVEVLQRVLRMLHPFAPFLCTELWNRFSAPAGPGPSFAGSVDGEPVLPVGRPVDDDAERAMGVLQEVVRAVRRFRALEGIAPDKPLRAAVGLPDESAGQLLSGREDFLKNVAGLSQVDVSIDLDKPAGYAVAPAETVNVFVEPSTPLEPKQVLGRLYRDRRRLEERYVSVKKSLESLDFIRNAPPEVVAKMKRIKRNLGRKIATVMEAEEELQPPPVKPPPRPKVK